MTDYLKPVIIIVSCAPRDKQLRYQPLFKKEQVESGQVIARPLTSKGLHRQWSAALLKNDYAPPYGEEFIELLSRPAMPMAKPGIIRLVSGRR